MTRKVKSWRVAEAIAKAMSGRLPPGEDPWGFAYDVGNAVYDLGNRRDSPYNFEARTLALGILGAWETEQARLDELMAAEAAEVQSGNEAEQQQWVTVTVHLIRSDGSASSPHERQRHAGTTRAADPGCCWRSSGLHSLDDAPFGDAIEQDGRNGANNANGRT
jgi:hypothetical protein